jgi:hypothetical protein
VPLRATPVALVWACFLARLAFYAAMLPLWEGYDEWAHFSVIRTMALHGDLLVARDQPVPRDVEASLQLAPVPWELRALPPPSLTHDAYWSLPADARARREADFRSISRETGAGRLTAYEALQPPLYYWMMAPILRLLTSRSLAAQVMIVRWCSILIASLAIPILFQIAQLIFRDNRIAVCCAAAAAVMPGFAIDVARVGNECLGVLLFTLLIRIGLDHRPSGIGAGIVLGLGLLTKAYFLSAVPAVLLLFVCRRRFKAGSLALLVSALVSAWWYLRNLQATGTLSGLSESVLLRDLSPLALLLRGAHLNWMTAIDSILFSHIYFGGWSSLMVRSWMYHVFYLLIAAASFGLLRARRTPLLWWPIAIYAAFWIGQLYNVLLLYVSKGLPGSMGWYMYAVVAAEVVICVAGLTQFHRWAAPVGVLLLGLLDLYTVHAVAIPYYTGMIRHKPNGAIAALHIADFQSVGLSGVFHRLAAFKDPPVSAPLLIALWLAWLAGTICLLSIARSPNSAASPPKPGPL